MTTSPALQPAIARFVQACQDVAPPELSLTEKRECYRLLLDLNFLRYGTAGPDLPRVEDHLVPVGGGQSIRVRLYYPRAPEPERTLSPAHLSLHGGGWWQGSIDDLVNEAGCRRLASLSGVVVAAVDYRLAPEHPFPSGFEDSVTALRWLSDHSHRLGIDPKRISVGGNSAGANLAAALCLAVRDSSHTPPPVFQLLEVPALDLSEREGVADDLGVARQIYLQDPGQALLPTVSPLLADDLTGLPPACIYVAEHDPLRLQGEAYAHRLRAAGVAVELEVGAGAVHGSLLLTRIWPPAMAWQLKAASRLAAAHQRGSSSGPA